MKQLYYTICHQIHEDGSQNGIRDIYVYDIQNNIPLLVATLSALSQSDGKYFKDDEEEIQDWLDDNSEEFNTDDIEYQFWEL